jgi:hypothetical protein
MHRFHATIHAQPTDAVAGQAMALGGQQYRTLDFARESLSSATFGISFEEALAALERLERLYCEPDGSFVWVSSQGEPRWQVDGNLFDRAGRLLFVDIQGSCPGEALDRLLAALGSPPTPIMFQLVRQAIFLDEATFREQSAAAVED